MLTLLASLLACAPRHELPVASSPTKEEQTEAVAEAWEPAASLDELGQAPGAEVPPVSAVARLEGEMSGAVAFTQSADAVKVSVNITGAEAGPHVLRIRRGSSCTFGSTTPSTSGPLVEDLAMVTADAEGRAHVDLTLDQYSINGGVNGEDNGLLGLAVIVDDGLACGVVASVP